MQEQPETGKEGDDPQKDHEEALYAVLGQSEKQRNSRRYKARQYFNKWENIVSALTLIFIIAYTGLTAKIMLASVESSNQAKIAANAAVEATRISKDIMLVDRRADLIHGKMELIGFLAENYAQIRIDITNKGHTRGSIRSNGVSYVNAQFEDMPDNPVCGPPSNPVLNAPVNGTRIAENETTYLIVIPRVVDMGGKPTVATSHGYILGFIEYDDGYSLRGDANPVSEYFCGRFEEDDLPGVHFPIRDCAVTCKKD